MPKLLNMQHTVQSSIFRYEATSIYFDKYRKKHLWNSSEERWKAYFLNLCTLFCLLTATDQLKVTFFP